MANRDKLLAAPVKIEDINILFTQGMEQYANKEFTQAVDSFHKAEEQGHVTA